MNEVLLFDLDGTLTDPREGITRCFRHALESLGVPSPGESELLRWIGPPLHHSLREYLGADRGHLVPAAVAAYRERFAAVGMYENAEYPGVSAGLEELKRRGFALFVATSKPTVFATQILSHFALSEYFSAVYGSELSGERADKRDLIAHLLRLEGITPDRATMIGDRAYDMLGARQNDVRGLGVLWGYGSRDELVDAGAQAVFATFSDLVAGLSAVW